MACPERHSQRGAQAWLCCKPVSMGFVAWSNNDGFWFQRDGKLIAYRALNRLCKRQYFRPACATQINQHQGMLRVNAGAAKVLALPTGLFNQPAGGNFYVTWLGRVVGQSGMGLL